MTIEISLSSPWSNIVYEHGCPSRVFARDDTISFAPIHLISALLVSAMKAVGGWADMRLTIRASMEGPNANGSVIAGSGGVLLGEGRTNHEGRKALLLVRGHEDTSEYEHLVSTMGIQIVEKMIQPGQVNPASYFGGGRLKLIQETLNIKSGAYKQVSLILLHTNATPRQLVAINQILGIEVWDRVRLLLALFTSHASSVEARTQVRISKLLADRTILREAVAVQTTGERAGYGGEGATALQTIIGSLNRELATLRKRLGKHTQSTALRREQRRKQGLNTVGLVGYTNAGKSSLFRALSGKKVLIEDKLFSTLEPTLGQMEKTPRILIADTIGFIDNIPNAALASFKSTFAEAIESEILLHLIDASDELDEVKRKCMTTKNELNERLTETGLDQSFKTMVVFTKIDRISPQHKASLRQWIDDEKLQNVHFVSSISQQGIDELRYAIFENLFGSIQSIVVKNSSSDVGQKAVHALYSNGYIVQRSEHDEMLFLDLWISESELEKLLHQFPHTIEHK